MKPKLKIWDYLTGYGTQVIVKACRPLVLRLINLSCKKKAQNMKQSIPVLFFDNNTDLFHFVSKRNNTCQILREFSNKWHQILQLKLFMKRGTESSKSVHIISPKVMIAANAARYHLLLTLPQTNVPIYIYSRKSFILNSTPEVI